MTPIVQSDCRFPGHAGTTAYRMGCRCERCREKFSEYRKAWRSSSPQADAERAQHARRMRERRANGERI